MRLSIYTLVIKNLWEKICLYNKELNENKDFTFTPRFYAKDQLLLQNEYREVNKNSNLDTDFSILADKGNSSESHLFFNLDKNVNIKLTVLQ